MPLTIKLDRSCKLYYACPLDLQQAETIADTEEFCPPQLAILVQQSDIVETKLIDFLDDRVC